MNAPVLERSKLATQPDEPKRCSDYDTDCAGVMCHSACHRGGIYEGCNGQLFEMLPADGYCQYLNGKEKGP